MRLLALILLLAAVGGWFFAEGRQSWGKTARQAAVWGLIFVGAVAIVGLWNDIRGDLLPQQARFEGEDTVEVSRRNDGHYYLTLQVNDTPVQFMIDTGASDIVLTKSDAERAGLSPDELNYLGVALTANGEVRTAPVSLETVALGPFTDRDVYAVVNNGEMRQSLLGMGYLQNWGKIEIEAGTLRLIR